MSSIPWNAAYSNSWIGKLFQIINRWWISSQVFKIGSGILNTSRSVFIRSWIFSYFQSNQLGISREIRKSYIIQNLTLRIFILFGWLNKLLKSLFTNSLTDKILVSVKKDIRVNPVRYFSSFFFSGFVIWVILMLLFGSGFSRPEMAIILMGAFLTWFLSLLEINTLKAVYDSRLLQWFISWAKFTDNPQGMKK